MDNKTLYAVVDGVKLTEAQLRLGMDQIAAARKAAEVKPGEFKVGDVVFFVGNGKQAPEPDTLRLAVRLFDNGRAAVLDARGYQYTDVPATWYAKAPKGTKLTIVVPSR